ncbi:3-phosphoshikimate 1-carboxyvinyltransferase [Paenibacillus algorifonticola]|uniref:3-phosphoshikimate 1-carboxyvinyltransferase n=1 Tax=Paenibacillus algorifonticola TaxID=684063 RepID=A0A1I2IFG1_9BACL|nr:3-phosphoshikimate 1-carboxyvinyltransferase [Paenibacillus algorifonticola]SFF41055.1 3-phosphoshikimate 1-carboxyvinyltransferase [Paenibacillus algorifonticola]
MDVFQPDLAARSPWSAHSDKQQVTINPPAAALEGTVRIPGSKSLTNRALIMAALAEGKSQISGLLLSDDSYWCIAALEQLGVKVAIDGETAYVDGCGGNWPLSSGELYVGAAGTIARFLPGALAIGNGVWTIKGSKRLSERPLAPLLDALTDLGATFEYEQSERSLPLVLRANGLQGGTAMLPGSTSSQFISGLLIAAPYAKAPITVRIEGEVVQKDYVEMTLEMMALFGAAPEASLSTDAPFITVPTGKYEAHSILLEPDVSTCCYFWALAALTAGRIRTEGIDASRTSQPDIAMLGVLEQMGCTVVRGESFVEVQGPERLKGGFTVSMQKWSDQTLTLAVLAIFTDGSITLKDAAHIRHHECDRIAAICTELGKLGIHVMEHEDGLTVYPGKPQAALLNSHDDHRMAMALSLIGSKVSNLRISDPGCVSKTNPNYFEQLAALGFQINY